MFNFKQLNLWNNCESILLETNFKQGEGAWANMLNRIRVGEQTQEDMRILESRIQVLPKELRDKAIHLFYTNIEVNEHNEYMLNSLEEMLEEIAASIFGPHGYEANTENGLIDKTQFSEILQLKKSARVMIIANVDIKDGIVNGTLGTVIDFVKVVSKNEKGEDVIDVKSIIVMFDDPETGVTHASNEHQGGVPIFRHNISYNIPHRKSSKTHGAMCHVKQFPLKLAWASTGHKVQGITIKVIIPTSW